MLGITLGMMLGIELGTAAVLCVAMTCATVILVILVRASAKAHILRDITKHLVDKKKQTDDEGKSDGDKLAEEIQRGLR